MKTVTLTEFGSPDTLTDAHAELPDFGAHEVLRAAHRMLQSGHTHGKLVAVLD
jgi:NADPH:quinone reductase-like Zn-dependent oxidoreductase